VAGHLPSLAMSPKYVCHVAYPCDPCRLISRCTATIIARDVAYHRDPERRVARGMSPSSTKIGDNRGDPRRRSSRSHPPSATIPVACIRDHGYVASRAEPNHATMPSADMAGLTSTFVVECRIALGLTQNEFGNILGRTKRTIQRWEDRGPLLIPQEVEALARALHPVRPDLAEKVAVATGTTLHALGIRPTAGLSADTDPIESVVRAAAEAMGVSGEAIRPAIAAAFARAHAVGLDVQTVAQGLRRNETR
jgi:DNA-binding transcriptional regulator YiaG